MTAIKTIGKTRKLGTGGKVYTPPQSRPTAESTAIPRPLLRPVQQPASGNNDRLSALPDSYSFPDGRSWGNPQRVKERMAGFQKAISIAQLAPIPLVKYPAMALNSALGVSDIADDIKRGDNTNLAIDAISSAPLPDGAFIRGLGTGTRVAAKTARVAAMADAANIGGAAASVTDNFGKKKFAGGGRLPFIDPKQFTNPDTNENLPPPDYDPSRFAPMVRGEQWGSGSSIKYDANFGPQSPAPATGASFLKTASGVAKSIVPYASNIVNAFRKVPKPARPVMDAPPVFQRVSMQNDRNEVSREVGAADVAADRTLDGNTAAAVHASNLGTKLNAMSRVNEAERNQNVQIGNQQSMANAQTAAANNSKIEDYHNDIKEGEVAQQREQSQNFANAADKYIAIGNEKEKRNVDMQKANVLAQLYSNSGVMNRSRQQMRAAGLVDPMGNDYKDLPADYVKPQPISGSIKRFGGNMRKPVMR